MSGGKDFESRSRKSLEHLPGYAERVHDNGGKPTNGTLCGDFKLYKPDGTVVAIECKSQKSGRIPFREAGKKGNGIHDEQLVELARFEAVHPNFKAKLALHWEDTDACVLVSLEPLLAYRKGSGYKSISQEDAANIGWNQRKAEWGWKLWV